MKKLLLFAAFVIGYACARGQSIYTIRADTLRVMKQGGNAELQVLGKYRDSIGLSYNLGNGVYGIRRSRSLNDSQFIVGPDTLTLAGAGAGAQGLADVMTFNNQTDTFSISYVSGDSTWLFLAPDTIYARNWRLYHDGVDALNLRTFNGRYKVTVQIDDVENLIIGHDSIVSKVPILVSATGGVPIAMIDGRAGTMFDTGVYGEVTGGVFSSKWGLTGAATGGTNNYGVEGIALGGSGIQASFRSTLPGAYGTDQFSYLGISLATSLFQGPIKLGTEYTNAQAQFQLDNTGSYGQNADSLPTISAGGDNLAVLVLDTIPGSGITGSRVSKIKLADLGFAGTALPDTTNYQAGVAGIRSVGFDSTNIKPSGLSFIAKFVADGSVVSDGSIIGYTYASAFGNGIVVDITPADQVTAQRCKSYYATVAGPDSFDIGVNFQTGFPNANEIYLFNVIVRPTGR